MTILDTREQPQTQPSHGADDITHEVCCLDEDKPDGRISMCGVDLADAELTCVVCNDLLEGWNRWAGRQEEVDPYAGDAPCSVCPKRRREQR